MRDVLYLLAGFALMALAFYGVPSFSPAPNAPNLSAASPMASPVGASASQPSQARQPTSIVLRPTPMAVPPTPTPRRPTPTSSSVPIKMAVLVAPTAMPFPQVELEPSQPLQGDTLLVRVRGPGVGAISGSFGEGPLTFLQGREGFWGFVGVPLTAEVGIHSLSLLVQLPDGVRSGVLPVSVAARYTAPEDAIALPAGGSLPIPYLTSDPAKRWQGTFIWPTEGEISCPFGSPRVGMGGEPGYHCGVDIAAEHGTVVRAANAGRVVWAGWLPGAGKCVIIDHGLGVHSGYYHLAQVSAQEGSDVAKGQIIGQVGSSGMSTGPHLHWEMRVGSVAVDPIEWTQRSFDG